MLRGRRMDNMMTVRVCAVGSSIGRTGEILLSRNMVAYVRMNESTELATIYLKSDIPGLGHSITVSHFLDEVFSYRDEDGREKYYNDTCGRTWVTAAEHFKDSLTEQEGVVPERDEHGMEIVGEMLTSGPWVTKEEVASMIQDHDLAAQGMPLVEGSIRPEHLSPETINMLAPVNQPSAEKPAAPPKGQVDKQP